jgi:serine/threonine protein kinase/predicted Zn-dependent protease
MSHRSDVVNVIRAVASGSSVDWDAVGVPDDSSVAAVLDQLRVIERVAAVHGAVAEGAETQADLDDGLHAWGPLTLLERVAEGSYGVVYRAWDGRLDREVALKLLRHDLPRDGASTQIVDEGRLLARVRHPNVAAVYGADRIDGRAGIWMEFVEGRTLQQIVSDEGPIGVAEAARIGIEVARGLAAVHRAGLVHRDVKAQNVIVQDDGRVVLTDFGAGQVRGADRKGTAGTPLYLAPEVLQGAPASPSSDVYSLGVLLYYAVTGTYPIDGQTVVEVRERAKAGARRSLRDTQPRLPRRFTAAVDRALSSAETRFANANEFERALETAASGPSRGRIALAGAGLAACAALGLLLTRSVAQTSTSPSGPRAAAIVTAFDNRSGNPLLDDTIDFLLERELAGAPYLSPVSRDRVNEGLVLMRKPATTRLDLPIAREIALRDGDIRAVVTGRVDKVGKGEAVSVEMIDPHDGSVLSSFTGDAGSEQELIGVVRRGALAIRQALGERADSIHASEVRYAKVTTPSLRAVQLYSQAASLLVRGRHFENAAAEKYLQEALREDPDFASAHILIAWVIRNQRSSCQTCGPDMPQARDPEEIRAHVDRALALADETTDVERNFIIGSAHHLRADLAASPGARDAELRQAVTAYEAVLRDQPDHQWALTNVQNAYARLKRTKDLAAMFGRLADLRPNSFAANATAADALVEQGELGQAERFEARARALLTPAEERQHPPEAAAIRLLGACEAWIRGDARESSRRLDVALAEPLAEASENVSVILRGQVLALTLGRVDTAQALSSRLQQQPQHDFAVARVLWYRGDRVALRALLAPKIVDLETATIFSVMWVDAGLSAEASRIVGHTNRSGSDWDPAYRVLLEEAVALRAGRFEDMLTLGNRHFDLTFQPYGSQSVLTASMMADALVALHRPSEAIQTLEIYTAHRGESVENGGFKWTAARLQLAGLYRNAGREHDARAVEDELSTLMVTADRDDPVLVELQRRLRSRR